MSERIVNVENRSSVDRRQSSVPVALERRSGVDRREVTKNGESASIFSALAPARRVITAEKEAEKGNILPAFGYASLALVNLPEDVRDIKNAWGQLTDKNFKLPYDHKNYQHDFSFFRGTFLEPLVDLKNAKNKELAKTLLEADKTLLKTKFGKLTMKLLNTEKDAETKVMELNKKTGLMEATKDINGIERRAKSYKGPLFGKLTARAMSRTTALGLAALALIEAPKIFKECRNGENFFEQGKSGLKQTIKSAVNIAAIATGIGYMGTMGAQYLRGPFGSLTGMGLGAVAGGIISDKVQSLI